VDCRKCRKPVPPQQGPGRRRTMCEDCSPRDRRDRKVQAVTSLPQALMVPAGSLVDATQTALTAADRLDTAPGALAVYLAGQLDAGGHSGSSTAALAREYRAAVEAATKGATGVSSALDELRERRARRRGA
jgi:hypothetical protein